MKLSPEVIAVLRCLSCGARLSEKGESLVCAGRPRHVFASQGGLVTFAKVEPGKYQPDYANQYAALWAYGFATRHSGLNEPLYRTVASLAAEALAAAPAHDGTPVIVDAGCGVGRTTADCAELAAGATVLGFDGSPHMLGLAAKVVRGRSAVPVDLRDAGFPRLRIPARGLRSVFLARADVERLPVAAAAVDLALSVNIIDRLPHGPEPAFRECSRILRPGGWLVFTDPLNWQRSALWKKHGSGGRVTDVLRLLERCGFELVTWFDDLWYREVLDARGSFEEFRTLVVKARLEHGTETRDSTDSH